jgi:arylformamidase
VVAISGIYDLEPIRQSSINDDLQLTAAEVIENSPYLYVPRRRCEVTLAVGGNETQGFRDQSSAYSQRLRSKGYEHSYVVVPGSNHYAILDDALDPRSELGRVMMSKEWS